MNNKLCTIIILLMVGCVSAFDPYTLQQKDLIIGDKETSNTWMPNETYCFTKNFTNLSSEIVVYYPQTISLVSMNAQKQNTTTFTNTRELPPGECKETSTESTDSAELSSTKTITNITCEGDTETTKITTIETIDTNLSAKTLTTTTDAKSTTEENIKLMNQILPEEIKEQPTQAYATAKDNEGGVVEFCFQVAPIRTIVKTDEMAGEIAYVSFNDKEFEIGSNDNYEIPLTPGIDYIPSTEIKSGSFNETKESIIPNENTTNTKMMVEAMGVEITTDKYTLCYWLNPSQPRTCYQNFTINNTYSELKIDRNFFTGDLLTLQHPDNTYVNFTYDGRTYDLLTFNEEIIIPNNTITNFTLVFDYPANQDDEWNLTITHINTDLVIDPNISGCGIIGAGQYNLTTNAGTANSQCMTMWNDNSILDCKGYRIYPLILTTGNVGVRIYNGAGGSADNITLRNCVIEHWDGAVYVGSDPYTDIGLYNLTINNSRFGVTTFPSEELVINNTYFEENLIPIFTEWQEEDNPAETCSKISLQNVTTNYGNISLIKAQQNLVVDGFNVSELIVCNSTNISITNLQMNNTLLLYDVNGVNVTNLNHTLRYDSTKYLSWDLGYSPYLDGVSVGVIVQKSKNVILKNLTTNQSYNGAYIVNSNKTTILNSSFSSNKTGYGGYVRLINNLTIANNTFNMPTSTGLYFLEDNSIFIPNFSGIDNRVYNNLFNMTTHIDFEFTTVNTNASIIYFNTTSQTGGRIFSSGTSFGGNFYATPTGTGFSEVCADITGDGFCDSVYTHYTDTLVSFIDNLPLSDNYGLGTFVGGGGGGGGLVDLPSNETEFYIEGQIGGCNLTYGDKCTFRVINPLLSDTNITITLSGSTTIVNQRSVMTKEFVLASPLGMRILNASGGYLDITVVENLPLDVQKDKVYSLTMTIQGNTKKETIPITVVWEEGEQDWMSWLNTPLSRFEIDYPEGNPQVVPFTNFHLSVLLLGGSLLGYIYLSGGKKSKMIYLSR